MKEADELGYVRPRPKPVDFHDVENRQWPCRMIIRHGKDSLECLFCLGALGKIKYKLRIVIAQPPSVEETGHQNY
ncbi:hypothetical protein TNCV_620271 [Trichonephila clavipes]|nr:hypothetical protein TNCV_620271 [Trichonephila clavipes]